MDIPTKSVPGLTLPVLGLGTLLMGGKDERNPVNDDDRDIATIRYAIECGITHIDTAEMYAGGYTETLVGRALGDLPREKVFLVSKVLPQHLGYADVIKSCQSSLKRLGTAYIDLYLIHGPNPLLPLTETMRALASLYEAGLIRRIGVSNFDIPLLEEAMEASRYPIVNNQVHYSLSARGYEENGTLAWCRGHNVLVTAYRPLGFGKGERGFVGAPLLEEIAKKYGKTSSQVALNWLMNKPGVVTLIKTSDPLHLDEDMGALRWDMNPADAAQLDAEFPRGQTIWLPKR